MMNTEIQPKTPLEVFSEWQRCLAANDQRGASEVVDVDGYTEICLGLTESTAGVTARSHVTATHTGEFLGIGPTGRRVEWDHVAIVKIRDGRVVGQWAQPDLWGIYNQLTREQPSSEL